MERKKGPYSSINVAQQKRSKIEESHGKLNDFKFVEKKDK